MTSSAAELLARGLDRHRRNVLSEAEQLYGQALAIEPNNPDALHLMGVLMQQQGQYAPAILLIQKSLALKPAPHVYANLANGLNQLGRWEEAEAAGRQAVWLDPRAPAAHCNLGVALRGQKKLQEAAASFRGALAVSPNYAGAVSNLGVVLTELGQLEEAEATLRKALEIEPGAQAWFNLGNVLLRQLRFIDAIDAFARSRALNPEFSDVHANLGAAYKALGRLDEALAGYQKAAALAPAASVAQHNLGLVLGDAKRHEEAVRALERAAELDPGRAAIYIDLGAALYHLAKARQDATTPGVLDRAIVALEIATALDPTLSAARYNLGLALLDRGFPAQAAERFREAMALRPDYAEAHCNLGHCLADLGEYDAAVVECERALILKPELAEAQSTLGNIAIGRHQLDLAETAYRAAIALRPQMGGAWCNLGVALFRQGKTQAALDACDTALIYSPDLADAHWNRALALLQLGRYQEGWAEYEWRLRRPRRIREDAGLTLPLWDGRPLEGRKLILHTEQGLGDAIQCARFIPTVLANEGAVVVQAQATLVRLFRGLPGVSTVIADEDPMPEADCRLPLFSLPRLFAATPEQLGDPTAAHPIPYLVIDSELKAIWAARLATAAQGPGLKIGIVWSGNQGSEAELGRSLPLKAFAPLAQPGVQLISLQRGFGLDQIAPALADGLPVIELGPDFHAGDMADTGAIVDNLDLIVCCDTAVAHLAGALGKPVWLAVNYVSDWRWLMDRTNSPWYPTLTVYRQPRLGDWAGAFEVMGRDLAKRLKPKRRRVKRALASSAL
jgi:tetratricopeptide (TPR) repeat protein